MTTSVIEQPKPAIAVEETALARPGNRLGRRAALIGFGLLLLGLWQWVVTARNVPVYLVPSPVAVFERLWAAPAYFASQAAVTTAEALAGLAAGMVVAVALAVLMAQSDLVEDLLYPVALLVKVTPIVAVAPLLVIWFGFGPTPKVIIAALITFFPILVNVLAGLRDVEPGAFDLFRSFAASPLEMLLHLRLPSALPYLFAALRVAVPLSLIGAVVAEWWGASDGLGRIIFLANSNVNMPELFAAVFVLAAVGILLTSLLTLLEQRVLGWHQSRRIDW